MTPSPDCHCRSTYAVSPLIRLPTLLLIAGIALTGACSSAKAQSGAKATPQKTTAGTPASDAKKAPAAKVDAKKPADSAPATKKPPATGGNEPATPEQAAKVLDLRTFPVIEGAELGNQRTLAILMYEAKSLPVAAFEFQRKELSKRGFKELPGGYSDAMNVSGHFTKEGFRVAVSASASFGDPKKTGYSQVSLVNSGNVDMARLPVMPGVKPFHPQVYQAAYTTDVKVADAAAACRKLLLAAGWEPYGQMEPNPSMPDTSMQYFKRNAIKLQSWVMITPAEGNKTLIQYDTELLSADLPAPPDTADPRYTDSQKTLRFDSPKDRTDAIIAFYQERLAKQGWKPTTERPVSDDRTKSQFVIYRNAQKELLSLNLAQFTDIVRVELKHQTETELAEEERQAKAYAAREKGEEAKRNMKVPVKVPLPATAGMVEKLKENIFEFTVDSGTCADALKGFRKHFLKEGWTEEDGSMLEEKTGNMELKKGLATLSFSYFDVGIGDPEIKISGSPNVVLETLQSTEKAAEDEPKAKKKTAPAGIPGLPDLPPGVELPDDVKALLKKAQEKPEKKKP